MKYIVGFLLILGACTAGWCSGSLMAACCGIGVLLDETN